jgi:molybdopterin/thiamine biosynthesis adenylyltransferase
MIVISGELIRSKLNLAGPNPVRFMARKTEGVYSLLTDVDQYCPNVPGTIFVSRRSIKHIKVSDIGKESDRVRVLMRKKALESNKKNNVRAYVLGNDGWVRNEVMIVPVKEQLYSRIDGLIETPKLAHKKVLIAGQGSGGSPISVGLVQSGVGNICLVDHDRLEIANIMRHVLGISDVGRFKTLAMADFLLRKNPFLNSITTAEVEIDWDNIEFTRGLVREADLAICATGDQISKRIMNRLCLQENKVLIIAGAFRRAYGGSVLRVTPGKSLCYQCLLQWFEASQDEEISNPEQAEGLAYTDRPVPIEPGLASDIQPISNLVIKSSIQALLKGTETTLQSLDEDLVAPLYLWANRREGQFENMKPLAFNIGSMSPLRWYGVKISRHPTCVECRHDDFIRQMTEGDDITEIEKDTKLFEGDDDEH